MDFTTIITITLALIFLTTGIIVSKVNKELNVMAVLSFWIGSIFNIIGVLSMGLYADEQMVEGVEKSALANIHGILGMVGTVSLVCLTIGATVIMFGKNKERKEKFYSWARFLWLIWLVPYFVGLVMGIVK